VKIDLLSSSGNSGDSILYWWGYRHSELWMVLSLRPSVRKKEVDSRVRGKDILGAVFAWFA